MAIDIIKNNKKSLFILILLSIFFYRSPHIFLNGRFMAEEGSIYFANAYSNNFFYSLFFVDFKSGYFNFWANISGIISNFFPLKIAPLISNYLSLIPKFLIIYFILFDRSYFTNTYQYKILLCLLIFIAPQNVPEIWLNSINSQIFFCILAFILIFKINDEKKINYFELLLISTAGLTGIYSCILAPIFFFKYLTYKKVQDKLNFITISMCAIIQIIIILYSKYKNLIASGKLHSIDLDLFHNFLYNTVIKSFLGTYLSKFFYFKLDLGPNNTVLILMILCVIFLFFLIKFLKKNIFLKKDEKFIFISILFAFFATSLIVLVGATSQYVGGRYAVLPSLYLLSLFLFLFKISINLNIRYFFLMLLILSISTGAYEFRPVSKYAKYQYIRFLDCINCPNWSEEVSKYYKDNSYQLKIWPYPRKTMTLSSF